MANNRVIQEIFISSYNKDELVTLTTDIAGISELVFSDGRTIETQAHKLVE